MNKEELLKKNYEIWTSKPFDNETIEKVKNLKNNIEPYVEIDRALKGLIRNLRNPLRAFFDRYEYIGPSRDVPTRTQIKQSSNSVSVGASLFTSPRNRLICCNV